MRKSNRLKAMHWAILALMIAMIGTVDWMGRCMREETEQRRAEERARIEAEIRKRYDQKLMEWLQMRNEKLRQKKLQELEDR